MIRLQLTAGEIPEPLEHTFADADGTVIDLTGCAGEASWQRDTDGATGSVDGVVDGPGGTVTVQLTAAVCAVAGVVDVQLWAGDGSHRYASPVWRLLLADPAGVAPAI